MPGGCRIRVGGHLRSCVCVRRRKTSSALQLRQHHQHAPGQLATVEPLGLADQLLKAASDQRASLWRQQQAGLDHQRSGHHPRLPGVRHVSAR